MVSIDKSAIHLSRRGALAAASAGSLLAMPWIRRSAAADGDTINIMGVETAALDDWTAFEQETGLKVAFTGINSDPGLFQQEIVANAAGDTTDIFLMDGGIQSTLGPKGYFMALDTTTLPGWDQLPDDLRHSPLLMGSDQKLYGIPAVLNADSFAYYPDAISEKEPLSLALLFESEETMGKVGLENTWLTTLPMAATYMKVAKGATIGDPANMTPAEAASVVDFLLERKRAGQFRLFWATFDESLDAMARRETIVSNVWEPVVKQLNRDGKDVRYAATREGYNKWLIGAYVASQVAERGNQEVVQKALAGLLGGAYSARIAELRGYGTAHPQLGLEYLKAHAGTPEQIQAVEANIVKIDQKFKAPLFWQNAAPDNLRAIEAEWERLRQG